MCNSSTILLLIINTLRHKDHSTRRLHTVVVIVLPSWSVCLISNIMILLILFRCTSFLLLMATFIHVHFVLVSESWFPVLFIVCLCHFLLPWLLYHSPLFHHHSLPAPLIIIMRWLIMYHHLYFQQLSHCLLVSSFSFLLSSDLFSFLIVFVKFILSIGSLRLPLSLVEDAFFPYWCVSRAAILRLTRVHTNKKKITKQTI